MLEHVRIKASVARLRSSLDMPKKTANQLVTSADNGGDGGDDEIERVSFELDEHDDRGVFNVSDEISSRRLLKKKKRNLWSTLNFHWWRKERKKERTWDWWLMKTLTYTERPRWCVLIIETKEFWKKRKEQLLTYCDLIIELP